MAGLLRWPRSGCCIGSWDSCYGLIWEIKLLPSFLEQGSFGRAFEVAPQQLLRWFGLAAPVLILWKMWGWSSVLVTSLALVLILMMILGAGLDLNDWSFLQRVFVFVLLSFNCALAVWHVVEKKLGYVALIRGPFVWSSPLGCGFLNPNRCHHVMSEAQRQSWRCLLLHGHDRSDALVMLITGSE